MNIARYAKREYDAIAGDKLVKQRISKMDCQSLFGVQAVQKEAQNTLNWSMWLLIL